jgi:hypothetical protein
MRPSNPATEPLGIAPISRCEVPRRGPGPAQVATRAALSIRKSATTGSDYQLRQDLLAIETGDPNALQARSLAGHDRDVALGNAKRLCEDGDQLVVRGAVDRRRRKLHEHGALAQARKSAASGARNDANLDFRNQIRNPKSENPKKSAIRNPKSEIPKIPSPPSALPPAGPREAAPRALPPRADGAAARARRATGHPDRG